jgi:hypothetical protein
LLFIFKNEEEGEEGEGGGKGIKALTIETLTIYH